MLFQEGSSCKTEHYANAETIMSGVIQGAEIDTSSSSRSRSLVDRSWKENGQGQRIWDKLLDYFNSSSTTLSSLILETFAPL